MDMWLRRCRRAMRCAKRLGERCRLAGRSGGAIVSWLIAQTASVGWCVRKPPYMEVVPRASLVKHLPAPGGSIRSSGGNWRRLGWVDISREGELVW